MLTLLFYYSEEARIQERGGRLLHRVGHNTLYGVLAARPFCACSAIAICTDLDVFNWRPFSAIEQQQQQRDSSTLLGTQIHICQTAADCVAAASSAILASNKLFSFVQDDFLIIDAMKRKVHTVVPIR